MENTLIGILCGLFRVRLVPQAENSSSCVPRGEEGVQRLKIFRFKLVSRTAENDPGIKNRI